MDNLTHAISGLLVARATAPRDVPGATLPLRRRLVLGAIAASVPDLDFVAGWLSPVTYVLHHRGVTHSFLMLPLWSLLLAWLCSKLWRDGLPWRAYFGVFAWGIGIHIVGDWITSYGTLLLAPLSDRRFALSTTFIIDLWLLALLLAGAVASLLFRRSRLPAAGALVAVTAYVAFQALLHRDALELGERHAAAQGLRDARISAVPRPVSPHNWMVVVETEERVDYAQVRLAERPALLASIGVPLFDDLAAAYVPPVSASWTSVARFGRGEARDIAREAFAARELGFFRWFAAHPTLHRIDRGDRETCVWFEDLRFVTPGRDVVPFRFGACGNGREWAPFKLEGDARIPL
jgi:inner membrane protein